MNSHFYTLDRRLALAAMLALSILLPSSLAGTLYEMTNTEFSNGTASETESSNVLIDGKNMKISSGGVGAQSDMLFQGAESQMVMIDHSRRQYMVFDKPTIEEIRKKMEQAMLQYEAMMKNAPPAQREMMEKMMKGKMSGVSPGQKAARATISKTDERKSINGYETVKYEVLENGIKKSEHWVASWSEVKGGDDVVSAFENMSLFFNNMMKAFSKGPMGGMMKSQVEGNWLRQMKSMKGFPVMTRRFDDSGNVKGESVLKSVSNTDTSAIDFAPPSDYRRQKMGM